MRSPWSRTRMPMPCVASLKSWDGPTRTTFFPEHRNATQHIRHICIFVQCIVKLWNCDSFQLGTFCWKSSVRIAFLLNQERENFRKSHRRLRHRAAFGLSKLKMFNLKFGINWYYILYTYSYRCELLALFFEEYYTWYTYVICIQYTWYDIWYMIYDIWYMIYDMIYDIWYMIWYDMIWYDMIWYMIYDIWYMIYDLIYDLIFDIWYMIYDMIWYEMKWYDTTVIWYMIFDIWYGIHIS